jgi:hypothetical protein
MLETCTSGFRPAHGNAASNWCASRISSDSLLTSAINCKPIGSLADVSNTFKRQLGKFRSSHVAIPDQFGQTCRVKEGEFIQIHFWRLSIQNAEIQGKA